MNEARTILESELRHHPEISVFHEALDMAIKALEEISLYKQGGLCLIPTDVYSEQCKQLDEYKELGTVEELRDAREKQAPKKPTERIYHDGVYIGICPRCGRLSELEYYCAYCGQKFIEPPDWSE